MFSASGLRLLGYIQRLWVLLGIFTSAISCSLGGRKKKMRRMEQTYQL